MLLARKIVFYTFLLIFLSLCPIIILYSFGYILQPEKKGISHTGLIHLASTPAGARVYLGKSRFKYTTPTTITELKPGEYQVSVRLKGYRPWIRQITIEAGKASVFKNILLLPNVLKETALASDVRFSRLTPLEGTDYFMVPKGARLKDFQLYNWDQETLQPFITRKTAYDDFPVSTVRTVNRHGLIAVYGGPLWGRRYLLIDTSHKDRSPKDITELFLKYPTLLRGIAARPEDLFAVYDNGRVDRLDIPDDSFQADYFDDVKGFGLSDQRLYLLGADNVFSKSSWDKNQKVVLFDDRHLGQDLFDKSRFYDIREIDREKFLFWGDRGDLITTLPPYRLADSGVTGIEYADEDDKFLFWTKNKIWTTNLNVRENEEDDLFQDRLQVNSAYQDGIRIEQCFWATNGTHVLFKDRKDVFLLELAADGRYVREHIVRVKDRSDIFYAEETGGLYYLDSTGNLKKIQVTPRDDMLHKVFRAEKVPL